MAFKPAIDVDSRLVQNPAALHCRQLATMKKSSIRYVSVVSLVWLAIAASSSARDIYVDNVAGNDLFNGTAAQSSGSSGPCRTIARGLRSANKGDRIILANTGEPYRESITLQAGMHSGSVDQPFEIVGNGAILEGAASVPRRGWEHVDDHIFRFSPPRKSYQMLFVNGVPAERVRVAPSDRQLPDLKTKQWSLFERYIYFCVEQGALPQEYDVSYSALPVGITLYEVRHVVIRDLIVQGFQLDGINAHDGVFGASLIGVTCRGNARSGISVGGASRVRIEGCVVGNNGAAQVRTEGYSHTRIINSHLLDNTAPPVVREGGHVHVEEEANPKSEARNPKQIRISNRGNPKRG